ncbi:MAG: cobalt transporter CbiM [candidate division WOR-3 bacterium]|nr:cobalt transporter CbiM [candidate division WOR-3 bacterium]
MHIAEGVLNTPGLIGGGVIAVTGTAIGLKKIEYKDMPRIAVLSSAFFVASLIHIPVGPASAHLILNGLAGIILGWASFPALLLALFLQAILFQFGGLTTLGVNTATMASASVLCFLFFRRMVKISNKFWNFTGGFLTGFFGVLLAGIFVASVLALNGEFFIPVAKMIVIAHIPVMVIEGILTGFVILFLKKIRPELLGGNQNINRQ